MLWMNGGPGTTSLLGLFNENGPFIVTENGTVEMRKYSWHVNHNVIYIDNPVGAGYSFTENNLGYVREFEEVGDHVLVALKQFFALFPDLRKNEFYIAGESYAAKFAAAVGYAIKIYNRRANSKINLKGLAIGNGLADPINQLSYYSDALHAIGLLDSNEQDQIRIIEEKLRILIEQEKYDEADDMRSTYLFGPVSSTSQTLIKNLTGFDYYYNYLQTQRPDDIFRFVDWVTKPDVREALHVGNRMFNARSQTANEYLKHFSRSAAHLIADLLEDYKVLIYHGQLDFIVTYIGTEKFIENLKWSGAEDYKAAQKRVWRVGHDIAGYSKVAKNLNFVLVRNAGHHVPTDQPLWASDMITRFTHDVGL